MKPIRCLCYMFLLAFLFLLCATFNSIHEYHLELSDQ